MIFGAFLGDDEMALANVSTDENPGELLFEANRLIKRAIDIRHQRGASILDFVPRPILVGWVKGELASRRDRKTHFGTAFLAEPAWDAFMVLFVGDAEGWTTTVDKIADMTGSSVRTIRLHIAMLEQMEFATMDSNALPTISTSGRETLVRYLTQRFNHMTEPPEPLEYLNVEQPISTKL